MICHAGSAVSTSSALHSSQHHASCATHSVGGAGGSHSATLGRELRSALRPPGTLGMLHVAAA